MEERKDGIIDRRRKEERERLDEGGKKDIKQTNRWTGIQIDNQHEITGVNKQGEISIEEYVEKKKKTHTKEKNKK